MTIRKVPVVVETTLATLGCDQVKSNLMATPTASDASIRDSNNVYYFTGHVLLPVCVTCMPLQPHDSKWFALGVHYLSINC
jgi:hypothetical protein